MSAGKIALYSQVEKEYFQARNFVLASLDADQAVGQMAEERKIVSLIDNLAMRGGTVEVVDIAFFDIVSQIHALPFKQPCALNLLWLAAHLRAAISEDHSITNPFLDQAYQDLIQCQVPAQIVTWGSFVPPEARNYIFRWLATHRIIGNWRVTFNSRSSTWNFNLICSQDRVIFETPLVLTISADALVRYLVGEPPTE